MPAWSLKILDCETEGVNQKEELLLISIIRVVTQTQEAL